MNTTKDAEGTIYRSNSFHVLTSETVVEVWNLHTGDHVELRGDRAADLTWAIHSTPLFGGSRKTKSEVVDDYLSQYI